MRFELAPSPRLAAAIVALHGAAGVSLLLVLPRPIGAALAVLVSALGVVSAWNRALLRSRNSVRAIALDGAKLELELASGENFAAEVAERRYVARFLVTLPVRRPRRRTLLVTQDMLGAQAFRFLRIWMLWGRLPAVAAKQRRP